MHFSTNLKSEYIFELPFDVLNNENCRKIIKFLVFLTYFFSFIHRHHYNQNHLSDATFLKVS
jgi:hypothetical protein